jgi:hypothetical protein
MLVALALKTAEETTPVENVLCSVTPHRWIFFFTAFPSLAIPFFDC